MSAITAKWISSAALFAATLAVAVLPVFAFNYFIKRKERKKSNQYTIRRTDTFNVSSTNSRTGTNLSNVDDNESITGSGENVIRRTRSNSITSISSISSRKLNKRSAQVLQILMFFGGGVLLATSFCHLMPEIKENFENYQHRDQRDPIKNSLTKDSPFSHEDSTESATDLTSIETTAIPDLLIYKRNITDLPLPSALHAGHDHDGHDHEDEGETNDDPNQQHKPHQHSIPWVEIAICGGFFFIYFLEELIHTFMHKHTHGFDSEPEQTIDDIRWDLPYQTKADTDAHLVNSPNKSLPCYDNYAIDFNSEPQLARDHASKRRQLDQDDSSRQIDTINQSELTTINSNNKKKLLPASVRFVQGLVTIGAFSAHSIFDGLAIGLQSSSTQIYTMLFAISMHKLVVAFAVGLELFDQTSSVYMTTVLMSLFSLMSPIGVWIVIFSQKTSGIVSEDQSLLLIMLNAFATGTIIYIVFFEVLQKDRSGSNVNGILLWGVMLLGFSLMLSVNIFIAG